jgi:Ala-tRNA(Pro) deacylase
MESAIERDEAALEKARQQVYDVFETLGIPYKVYMHPPIFSAAERYEKQVNVDGLICKNLFLRNKDKSRYYLYTLPLDKRANLVGLQQELGESRLSFGDSEALWELLRITPGSVSLLNIIGAYEKKSMLEGENGNESNRNDPGKLKFIIDTETLSIPGIGLHPNDNAATIVFAADQLSKLLDHYEAEYEFIELDNSIN